MFFKDKHIIARGRKLQIEMSITLEIWKIVDGVAFSW